MEYERKLDILKYIFNNGKCLKIEQLKEEKNILDDEIWELEKDGSITMGMNETVIMTPICYRHLLDMEI